MSLHGQTHGRFSHPWRGARARTVVIRRVVLKILTEAEVTDDLVAAWEKPFLNESQGGCAPQAQHAPWFQEHA